MPKAKRPPVEKKQRAIAAAPPVSEPPAYEAPPVFESPVFFETPDRGSAILYQPARVMASAPRSHAARMMMRETATTGTGNGQTKQEHGQDPEQRRVSILSQELPEATSYSGRNYVTLQGLKGAAFRQRSGDSPMIVFDGATYVECGNPQHLQGNPASGFTVEA